jgi:hypothetical protein
MDQMRVAARARISLIFQDEIGTRDGAASISEQAHAAQRIVARRCRDAAQPRQKTAMLR